MKLGLNLGTPARDLEPKIIGVLLLLYIDTPMCLGTFAIPPFIIFFLAAYLIFFYNPLFSLSFFLKCICGGCLDIEENKRSADTHNRERRHKS